MSAMNDMDALVFFGDFVSDVTSLIGRLVIVNNNFQFWIILCYKRAQTFFYDFFFITCRNHDCNETVFGVGMSMFFTRFEASKKIIYGMNSQDGCNNENTACNQNGWRHKVRMFQRYYTIHLKF